MNNYLNLIFNGNPCGIPNSTLYLLQCSFTYHEEERKVLQTHVKKDVIWTGDEVF